MKKSILLTSIIMMLVTISFGQVSTSSTGRVSEIKTDFVFNLVDGQFNKPLFRSGWLSDVGDYISIKHGGNNTEAATYGFRISDAQGFDIGKNDFNTSFLKIKPNGYVGIGYSNPASPLHIVSNYDGIMTLQTSDDSWLYTNWKDKNGTRKAYVGFDSSLTNFRINLENGADRFTVNGANVGIGTTNPQSKLHISNGSSGGITHDFSDLTIEDNDNTMINLLSPNNKTGYYGFSDPQDNYVGGMQYVHTTNSMIFRVNDHLNDMTIDQNGNVGIGGSTSPGAKLEVRSSNNLRIWLNRDDQSAISFVPNNGNSIFHISHGLSNDLNISAGTNPGGSNIMTIKNSGAIGIGTTNPDAKLTVKGNIHTQEVKVDLNGAVAPDYVFLEDYDLKTINEVEAYIKDQGHLPNIPSAAEMEQNGIELKQMNLNLLEKIEELTLYTIAQEKQLKEANNKLLISDTRLQTLEDKNKELETRLEKLEKILTK